MPAASFEDVESDLSRDWDVTRQVEPDLGSRQARGARLWHRLSDSVERAIPGDSDRDGK